MRCDRILILAVTLVFSGALGSILDSVFYGIIFNDTKSDVLRYIDRAGDSRMFKVPAYNEEDLRFYGVDSTQVARQAFGRGLCSVNEQVVAAGSSPSTVSLYDIHSGERLAAVNLTMDIRNAIHGLEVWPFE